MVDGLLEGLTKGGSGTILLIFILLLLCSGGLGDIFGGGGHGRGFDSSILFIFLIFFLIGDFF
ncbi:MAG: hypothetical protein GX987_05685 [Tissierellia bacterium]|nr:hypothetical protein [Tissierellia bacterium]